MTTTTPGATQLLGNFAVQTSADAIPAEVMNKGAYCLLDALGLAILAREEKTFVAVESLLAPLAGGPNSARVWSSGRRVSLSDAVTANAVAVHGQFHDDTDYSSWTHPGSLIVPVALSVGDSEDLSVTEVLRSIVIGYDAIEWLGARAEVGRALIERGVRTSPTLGTVGAAASAAALLGLDAAQAGHAIGIASSITGGVLEPVRSGSDEWRVQNARAASGGLMAAQLARQGIAGAPTGLEGPKGLAHSMAGLRTLPARWATGPDVAAILGVSAKPWATLGDNMSAVVAAKLIHDEGIRAADIESVRIHIWRHFTEYPGTSYRGPFDRIGQALASMAFATAGMLVYGELEYDKSSDHRQDPAILSLIERITIEPDDQGDPYKADVKVVFKDGRVIHKHASEAAPAQLFHDAPTALALFESRLLRSGYASGAGTVLATKVLKAASGRQGTRIREVLDALAPGVAGTPA
ncbi:MAG: MmgE/PrpD family protein [Burkholderiaceae bacterium]|nr:MmgE/PrpD family protein [Burkholderiaceae bacterium]